MITEIFWESEDIILLLFYLSFYHLYIQDDTFLEDVNMILNTGDIPNLYENDERLEIIEKVSSYWSYCAAYHIHLFLENV